MLTTLYDIPALCVCVPATYFLGRRRAHTVGFLAIPKEARFLCLRGYQPRLDESHQCPGARRAELGRTGRGRGLYLKHPQPPQTCLRLRQGFPRSDFGEWKPLF